MLKMHFEILIAFAIVTVINGYPITNSSCDCVCGLKAKAKQLFDDTNSTQSDENPWVVGVFWSNALTNFACSGTLISNEHVLVSAKCAERVLRIRQHGWPTEIRMGYDINFNGINTVKRDIARVYVHKNYDSWADDYNIAIFQLDKVVPFGDNIQPICLPQSPYVDYSGKLATAIGTYDTETREVWNLRTKTQQTHIPIWTNEQCAQESDLAKKFTENMMCAGDYKDGIMRPYIRDFDFGQIAVVGEHGSMELVGIYSFGHKSGLLDTTIVYTRVANFLPWIQSKLNNKCMCATKNGMHNDSLEKPLVTRKTTNLCLQPAKNSSCDCVCGLRESQKQVIDEVYTTPNQYPWVVGAFIDDIFVCSGALISKKHVLFTAYNSEKFLSWRKKGYPIEVRLGSNAINTMKRGVSRIYLHENYNSSLDLNNFNIGIWLLDELVTFGYNIQPICLPNSSFVDYTRKFATATGWYCTNSKSSFVSISKSHQIHIPIWTNDQCAEQSDFKNESKNNIICAGEYENGIRRACMCDRTCTHDLEIDQIAIENEHGNMELVGLHSFGPTCGTLGVPAIYTRVASFLPWIRSKIKQTMDVCS